MKRKKGRPSSNTYFTKDTENAIVKYNNTEDSELKSKIYQEEIHYAFNRLVEAITHRFKFYHTQVDYLEQLHHEVETFLLSKIHLFDPSKGAKAYSYFGTIAKRYLIIQNTKNYKKKINTSPIEGVENDGGHSYVLDKTSSKSDLENFMDYFVEFCAENLEDMFPNQMDMRIADAILELFRRREQLDIISKKALYIYIREMVPDVNTPRITKIANRLKEVYKDNYNYFLEYGYVDFDY
jgi:hypothetical protein